MRELLGNNYITEYQSLKSDFENYKNKIAFNDFLNAIL